MEGAAQTLVSNFGLLVGEEFQKLRGVGGEVAQLRDELATMNALLRMQSEAEQGAVDHFLREWMKQLRELAYDAEDCVHLYLFRIRRRPGDGFLVWSKRLLATLLPRRRLAGDIRALRARAAAINEQHARYGVSLEPLRRHPSLAQAQVSAQAQALRPANDPNQLVGISGQANTLAEMVKAVTTTTENDEVAEMRLKVFSIVGFGGLGKTTLAMEVCRQLEADFQRQAQVSVSQAFHGTKDLKGLLKRVLLQIVNPTADDGQGIKEGDNVGNIDSMDEDELAGKLKATLHNKRYLIVMDDVWTVAAWDAIQSMLPDNNCGSRIIVTTRIDTVARACSSASDCIYQIEALSLEDSKRLFLSRAFGSTNGSCPRELEQVMEKVLKKCGGLPLAIVSIASILARYKSPESKHMWETILKSIGSQMESHPTMEGMKQIVLLSFDHLPHHLKACMMYLSIFPEDYVIVKERLLMRWIAEGLVAERRGLTLIEVAEAYFDELVSRNMIDQAADIVTYYDGREETCRVHDMMLEVMVTKSLEANFVSLIGGQYEGMSYDIRVRRLSIHGGVEPSKQSSGKRTAAAGRGRRRRNGNINGMNVQHVRSLSVFELDEGHKLLDQLGDFTLLRVLDLEDCKGLGKKHMGYICRMYLLRFLNLKGTDVNELPLEVGKLVHLQTLDARLTCLTDLPKSVTELEELQSLQFSNKHDNDIRWMPPPGLNRMKALRKANKVVVRSDVKVAQEICELKQLQEMGIYVDSRDDIHQDVHVKLVGSLGKLHSLRCLNIGDIGFDREAMNFLHRLRSPPRLLRYLRIGGGLVGRGLPDWVGLLTNLVEFVIAWAYLDGDQLFDLLCKLPNLKRLTLETYFYRGKELVARTTQCFQELTDLRVTNPPGIPAVYQFEKGSMPKLERLLLQFGRYELRIVGIEHLTNLKEVHFTGQRGNNALKLALENMKEENGRRKGTGSNQFTVKVRYE